MSIRLPKSLDNTPSKVYNEVKDTTTNPLLKNSGFNRYTNTPSAALFPEDTSGGEIENNGTLIKYDRDAAAAYGIEYGKGYNFPEYMPMDSIPFWLYYGAAYGTNTGLADCANFVSQCLEAGNIKQTDNWYYDSKANTPIESALQPDNPLITNYYTSNGKTTFAPYEYMFSPIWSVADNQYRYFSNPENGYTSKAPVVISSPEAISSAIEKYGIQKGDLLYWSSDGGKTVHHATIISEIGNGEIRYAGHTKSATRTNLSDKMKEYPSDVIIIVLMNDYIKQ